MSSASMASLVQLLFFRYAQALAANVSPVVIHDSSSLLSMGSSECPVFKKKIWLIAAKTRQIRRAMVPDEGFLLFRRHHLDSDEAGTYDDTNCLGGTFSISMTVSLSMAGMISEWTYPSPPLAS